MSDKTDLTRIDIDEDEFIAQAEENKGFSQNESIIPFTRILQPLSPQLGVTPGAQAGMLLNVATGHLTGGKEGMTIIPLQHRWNYTEWTPREEGGGFVADWDEDDTGWQSKCEPDQKYAYKPMTRDGHVIVKARHFFIFNLLNGEFEPSILPFTGTGLKVARGWSSMLQNAPKIMTSKGMMVPAHFYYLYKLTVEEVKNSQYRWFEPRINLVTNEEGKAVSIFDLNEGKNIWQAAVQFRNDLKAGTIKAASQEAEAQAEDTY